MLQNRNMAGEQNAVGAVVRKLRVGRGLTQEQLAARLQVLGLDLNRAGLSKIEARLRCVTDLELPVLALALKVEITDLYRAGALRKRPGQPSSR